MLFKTKQLWPILLLFKVNFFIVPVDGFNILLFLIGTNQFERSTFEYLAHQLARRHHDTITVKPILIPEEPRLVQPRLHLVREKILKNLLPKRLYEPLQNVIGDVPWRLDYEYTAFDEPYWMAHNYSCKKMLNSNLMDVLAHDQIDVAIVYAGNPCQLAIVHTLRIPFIYFDVAGFTDETRLAAGMELSIEEPKFSQLISLKIFGLIRRRFSSALILACEFIAKNGFFEITTVLPCPDRIEKLEIPISRLFAEDYEIKRKFRNAFPNVNQIKQNAELYFLNTDVLLESCQNFPTNVVPIAGVHVDEIKPLFAPWNTSIAEAKHGVIILSLGTQVDTSKMPKHFVQIFLKVLSKFSNYRIFWRIGPKLKLPGIDNWEEIVNSTIPAHINITTYIPQNELLASRRTRLLITNGGIHSIIEALSYGVPIIGIPLYGTNRDNLEKVRRKGLGLIIEKSNLSESNLKNAINKILNNAKYAKEARDFSTAFQSRPASPFEVALYHIEHIARHRSAKFLSKSAVLLDRNRISLLITIFFRFQLDIWLALLVIALLTILLLYLIFKIQIYFLTKIFVLPRFLVKHLFNSFNEKSFHKNSKLKNYLIKSTTNNIAKRIVPKKTH